MKVANPIYDIVFKYLMEDERIARTILSALLRMEVTHVEQRRNEYIKGELKGLTLSRIDFGATVRDENGEEKLMLVELQKTWVETETLRFRQYLAEQYNDKENMMRGNRNEFAIPMVTVYLLGHLVGDIEEPVLYVRQEAYDYMDHPVTKGLPDPFVDSLTHSSIIVQIPRLKGLINNRLFKVLSIFDQSHTEGRNKQIIDIDEANYEHDDYMQPIFRRLLAAASDSDVRKEMNIEDEIASVLEKHETEIMVMNDKLRKAVTDYQKASAELQQASAELQQKDSELQQKDSLLRKSVLALKASMPIAQLAETLGISVEDVERLSANCH